MIKLIVTDIDGTLIEAGKNNLDPAYYDIFLKLIDKGVHVAVASGRHVSSVRQAFAPIFDKIWILSQNGSVVGRGEEHKALKPIPKTWIQEMWQDLSQYPEVESILDTPKETFTPFEGTTMFHIVKDDYKFRVAATGGWDQIPDETYSMFTLYHPENAEKFCNTYLKSKWEDRLEFFATGPIWVDFVMPGNNKGHALSYLCDHLGINPEEAIAFGDNMNDIPMLKAAGKGIAVASAREEVLAIADEIVAGPDQKGVLKKLHEILETIS